jgi:hypothetical protein
MRIAWSHKSAKMSNMMKKCADLGGFPSNKFWASSYSSTLFSIISRNKYFVLLVGCTHNLYANLDLIIKKGGIHDLQCYLMRNDILILLLLYICHIFLHFLKIFIFMILYTSRISSIIPESITRHSHKSTASFLNSIVLMRSTHVKPVPPKKCSHQR